MLDPMNPNGQRTPLLAANGHGHKSDAVRGFLEKFPTAKPAEVVAGLKRAGVEMTASLVSSVKAAGRKATPRKTRRGVKAKRA